MTVNLSQGLTLPGGVLLDCGSFFEFGSLYTALSRATESKKIKIVTFPVERIEADLKNEFCWV